MPKQTLSVTDEDLKWGLDTLPASTKVTEGQAARILGISAEALRFHRRQQSKRLEDADAGRAAAPLDYDLLPFNQKMPGGRVRYELGDVRRAAARDTHTSRQARDAARKARDEGLMGFGSWLASASLEDTWPFTIVRGLPIDFATSLALADEADWEDGEDQVQDLTLDRYLQMRREAAEREAAPRTSPTRCSCISLRRRTSTTKTRRQRSAMKCGGGLSWVSGP